jgi:tryptophanyl-tRNA synthetase
MKIDPWGSGQVDDYARLRDEFGIEAVDDATWSSFESPHALFERGVVFGHRGLGGVVKALSHGDHVGLMTGLMPSGRMHFGHKAVIDQVVWWQEQGADVHLGVADFEAFATRGFTIEEARKLAEEEYILTYLALGLDPKRAEVYFQSLRTRVKDLAYELALRVNWSQMRAMYGFGDETSVAHVMAPLVQAADILHVQSEEFGGPRPTVVPVGVDQDPHVRLTRDLAASTRLYSVRAVEGGGLGVFIKPKEPRRSVKELLDDAQGVLRSDLGFSDLKRKDDYRALYVKGAQPSDAAAIDGALARVEAKSGERGFVAPSSTYHRFMSGLNGGKMSSSKPENTIFITESPKEAEAKLKRAKTGGLVSAEEQRKKGANPYVCSVYEFFLYHLAKDAKHLETVFKECTTGARLCGGCKSEAVGLLKEKLAEVQERREASRHLVKQIVRSD